MNLASYVNIHKSNIEFNLLMIDCYIFSRDCRLCCIFLAFGRGVMEPFPYNKQASRQLFPVECIITDEKCILTLRDNMTGDIHGKSMKNQL